MAKFSKLHFISTLAILVMGLFVLTATAMADVAFSNNTFTGSGTYSEAVDNGSTNLTANPDNDSSITFTNNLKTTGQFQQNSQIVNIGESTNNSFGTLLVTNGSVNNGHMHIYGDVEVSSDFIVCNKWTAIVTIHDGANLSVAGVAYLNNAKNSQGIVYQQGGTVTFTTTANTVRFGHWRNDGYRSTYNLQGGELNIPNTITYVGWDGTGGLNISGGVANLKGVSITNSTNGKGLLTLTGGTLNVGSNGVGRNLRGAGSPGAATVNLGQGTINASESHSWRNGMTITLTGRSAADTADVPGGVTTFNAGKGKTITISDAMGGVGALTKTGAGTLTLSGNNTYTGTTTIKEGVIIANGANSSTGRLGTGAVIIEKDAKLECQKHNQLGYGTPNNITIRGTFKPDDYTHVKDIILEDGLIDTEYTITSSGTGLDFGSRTAEVKSTGYSTIKSRMNINNNATVTINVESDELTIDGVIKGAGGFTKTGAGTLTLSGANTYTGETIVSAGVLELTGDAVVANGLTTVGANGTLVYDLAEGQTKKLEFKDSIKLASTGSVYKTGEGTLQLYAAAENMIDASKFIVSSGRLDMKEYYTGALEIGKSLGEDNYTTATFSPGNSVGTLNITGDFTLNPGSTLLLEFDETGADSLIVSGATEFAHGSFVTLALAEGASPLPNQQVSFQLSPDITTFDNAALLYPSYLVGIGYDPTTGILSATVDANAVPEPSTWALLVLGVVVLFLRKRKN